MLGISILFMSLKHECVYELCGDDAKMQILIS